MNARSEEFVASTVTWLNTRFATEGIVIGADTPLFAHGIINSLGVLELIAWTEEAIGSEIPDRDIRMDNFGTVTRIAQVFVEEDSSVVA